MTESNIVKRLWDYGWITQDNLQFSACGSDIALLGQYIQSKAFRTFFIPGDGDFSEVHGPFEASKLNVSSFVPLELDKLPTYLSTIEFADSGEDDVIARSEILKVLSPEFSAPTSSYRLNVDERNKEMFHDSGFVLWIFREVLFLNVSKGQLKRFVIGYD
jgi:hypothetical protein